MRDCEAFEVAVPEEFEQVSHSMLPYLLQGKIMCLCVSAYLICSLANGWCSMNAEQTHANCMSNSCVRRRKCARREARAI